MPADVVVVGAGIAGCSAAVHLGRRGHSVVVLERETFPREKACGEGLMPHGVAELGRLGLLGVVAPQARPFVGIGYHVDEVSAVGRFPDGPGLGVRRYRLDAALAEAAAAVPGVELRTGVRAGEVRFGADGVEVATSDGPVWARAIVVADGLRSPIRKQLGLSVADRGAPRYGARLHVRLGDAVPERDVVDVHLAERCEFYVTPTGPREINLAVLCGKEISRSLGGDLDGGLRRLADGTPAIRALLAGSTALTAAKLTGPLRQRVRGVVADRAVLVGDAAGFVDAITGEGMSLALIGSRLAAETLSEGLRGDRLARADLLSYERDRQRIERDLRVLTEVVLLWARRRWLARHVVGNLARRPEVFERLLGVVSGRTLGSMRLRDLWRLLV